MGRHTLRIIMVLGALVTLVGGTGIFAVFSDRATAGQNEVASGARPRAADLKIEAAVLNGNDVNCDADVDGILFANDDTSTPQFTAFDIQPGANLGQSYVCLMNAGSAPLAVTASSIDLADIEVACSGDEAASGDTTCGSGSGELSPLLIVYMDQVVCTDVSMPFTNWGSPTWLTAFANHPVTGGMPLGPGAVACLRIEVQYPTPGDESLAQQAQTDSVAWRFVFDGTAS
jgi:hypothetical protein